MDFLNKEKGLLALLSVYLKNIFNWTNFRWLIAEFLHHTILINGAIISGTGSFKAIPTLFGILGIPSVLITPFCWLAASTAFVCFYVQFDDSMSKTAYYCIDACRKFIEKYILRKKEVNIPLKTITPRGQLEYDLNQKQIELSSLKESNEAFCLKLIDSIAQEDRAYSSKSLLPTETHNKYHMLLSDLLIRIRSKARPTNIDFFQQATPKNTKDKLLNYLFEFYKLIIKSLSIGLVLLGCAVVIGMGIITTQAFVSYIGIAITGKLVIGAIVLASSMKQLCQMTLTVTRQNQFYCALFGIVPTETQMLQKEITDKSEQITEQQHIEQTLKQIKHDIKQTPSVAQFIGFKRVIFDLVKTDGLHTLQPNELRSLLQEGLAARRQRATGLSQDPSYLTQSTTESCPPPRIIITPASG